MRLPPLALVALVAVTPSAGRGDDASSSPGKLEAAVEGGGMNEAIDARPARGLRSAGTPRWGLALGGGFPDFVTASLVFRPVSHLRFSAGPAWNYVGWGVQGGVALVPWRFWIAPVVSLEGGRFFRTNLGFLVKDSAAVPPEVRPLLEKVAYSYAALDVGLELGSQRGFSSSIRLGLSYVSIAAHATATYTRDDGTAVSVSDPALHGMLPSLKVGLQHWF